MKKVTLDQIAHKTGLSKYAVSRAISGKSGVSEETRRRVLEACDALGYVRSTTSAAAGQQIVVFMPRSQSDDFWMRVIRGIESSATREGYTLSLKTIDDAADSAAAGALLNSAAAAIFISHKTAGLIRQFCGRCPTLLLTYPPVPLLPSDCMNIADAEAMEGLCDHLLHAGHRSIAYYGPMQRSFGRELMLGIRRSLEKAPGCTAEFWADDERENGFAEVLAHLRSRYAQGSFPTAILCAGDRLAQSVLYALGQLGISVPQEISVTSFNSDTGTYSAIPFTTMGIDKFAYGEEAFRILSDRMQHPKLPFRRLRYLQEFLPGTTAGNAP